MTFKNWRVLQSSPESLKLARANKRLINQRLRISPKKNLQCRMPWMLKWPKVENQKPIRRKKLLKIWKETKMKNFLIKSRKVILNCFLKLQKKKKTQTCPKSKLGPKKAPKNNSKRIKSNHLAWNQLSRLNQRLRNLLKRLLSKPRLRIQMTKSRTKSRLPKRILSKI